MNRVSVRPLIALFVISVAGLTLSVPGTATAAGGGHSPKATCSQLSKAQIQPLLVNPITKVTVKPETSIQFNGKRTHIGQQCVYAAGSGDSEALTVTVIGGPFAANAYAADVESLGPRPTRVSGVGSKAVRASVDSNGAAATSMLSSIRGSTYCQVVPQSDDIPGVAQLEEAAGATSDIGNTAYGEIAAAIGTICKRVYGSGNTTPHLSGLTASAVTTTTGDGGLPTNPTLPTDGGN